MRIGKALRVLLTLYVGAFLCLLVPLHLLHLESDFKLSQHLEQSHDDDCLATSHHSSSCPMCQLAGSLIEPPAQCHHAPGFTAISIFADGEGTTPPTLITSPSSSRAPPQSV